MSKDHHYDTVAFDVRDNTTMLFFAKTGEPGDINDYLLLMRTIGEDFDETLTIEINEEQVSGPELIQNAELIGNTLKLTVDESVSDWKGVREFVLTFEETDDNFASIEAGAFRVLGDTLSGGNA